LNIRPNDPASTRPPISHPPPPFAATWPSAPRAACCSVRCSSPKVGPSLSASTASSWNRPCY